MKYTTSLQCLVVYTVLSTMSAASFVGALVSFAVHGDSAIALAGTALLVGLTGWASVLSYREVSAALPASNSERNLIS